MAGETDIRPKVLVIGIGNEHRGDDTFGLLVARNLRQRVPEGVTVAEHDGEGAALIELWQGYSSVILIDAVESGGSPGATIRIDAASRKIPARLFQFSSHAFGVAHAVETARALGRLPSRVVIFGAEGGLFGLGDTMSFEVAAAVNPVVESVLAEIQLLLNPDS